MRFERGQAIDHITRLGVVGGRIPGAFQIAVDIQERELMCVSCLALAGVMLETGNGTTDVSDSV